MPDYVIERLTAALAEQNKQIKGSRVLIVGLAYKPNVVDDRESPGYVLMEKLEALGATVDYHDPHVPVIRPSRKYSHYAGRQSIPWTADAMSQCDAALIATAHDSVDHTQLTE
jgi:UDP-N-acetyl-D-glucosamine dehydrogenase